MQPILHDLAFGNALEEQSRAHPADEPYLDEVTWNRIWTAAVKKSGIPFKPTAYQMRHTHASWLIDAGENPKTVMHRLGQSDLRTTSRYVHVLDETGESAARRLEGMLPPGVTPRPCRPVVPGGTAVRQIEPA